MIVLNDSDVTAGNLTVFSGQHVVCELRLGLACCSYVMFRWEVSNYSIVDDKLSKSL